MGSVLECLRPMFQGHRAGRVQFTSCKAGMSVRELEAAKEILGEVFGVSEWDVEEMIKQRLEEGEAA
ncbi:MAG: hypothetical protein GKC10_09435 [Methanosarcinales archaeon]|nr:hypothetical protein [Methanosarcinales archaeon]